MNEWINVKDKLPELRQKVLVFVPDDTIRCDIGMIVGTAERQICNPPQTVWLLWGSDHRTADVTHWMLLPEPPAPEGPFNFTDDAIEYTENGKVVAVLNVLAPVAWAMKDVIEWVNEVLAPTN